MPPEIPQVYGVFERHNQTLLDMVRSMMLSTKLSLYFLGLCFRDYRFYTEKERRHNPLKRHHMSYGMG